MAGLVDMSIAFRRNAEGTKSQSVDTNGLSTSHLAISSREELDEGWHAEILLGTPLRPDVGEAGRFRGDPFWSRAAWVGLARPGFSLRLGRQATPSFLQAVRFNALADSMGFSPVLRHTFAGGQSPISAMSAPDGASGSAVSVGFSIGKGGQAAALVAPARRNISIAFQDGAIAWGLANERTASWSGLGRIEHWQAGLEWHSSASWRWGLQGLQTSESRSPASRRTRTVQAGLVWNVNSHAVKVSVASSRVERPDEVSVKRLTTAVALVETLTARTDLYTVISFDRLSVPIQRHALNVGLRHRF